MISKVREVSRIVEDILGTQPATRDSDQLLILEVWEYQGLYLNDDQKAAFLMVANPESIRRTRQKFQERSKYLGSPKVKKERYMRSLEMEQSMPSHKPKYDPSTNTMRMF